MRESQLCHHRFVDCQENTAFKSEDGITVFGGTASMETCLNCNHVELPIETKEIVNIRCNENNRKISFTSMNLCEFSTVQF